MRVTGSLQHVVGADHRVIPACTGNSIWRSIRYRSVSGHPCVCGEQRSEPCTCATMFGSSLRVRGTACQRLQRIDRSGVIPACAGNRLRYPVSVPAGRGHPCVCGEQHCEPTLRQRFPDGAVEGAAQMVAASRPIGRTSVAGAATCATWWSSFWVDPCGVATLDVVCHSEPQRATAQPVRGGEPCAACGASVAVEPSAVMGDGGGDGFEPGF